jgi:hypothetical protein
VHYLLAFPADNLAASIRAVVIYLGDEEHMATPPAVTEIEAPPGGMEGVVAD